MRILVTGSRGMLGQELMEHLAVRHETLGLRRAESDITEPAPLLRSFNATQPQAVIHTAALTAVDECERRPELAFQVNAEGTRNVALACRQHHIPMLYISTDYVFAGEKSAPYLEEVSRALNAHR